MFYSCKHEVFRKGYGVRSSTVFKVQTIGVSTVNMQLPTAWHAFIYATTVSQVVELLSVTNLENGNTVYVKNGHVSEYVQNGVERSFRRTN